MLQCSKALYIRLKADYSFSSKTLISLYFQPAFDAQVRVRRTPPKHLTFSVQSGTEEDVFAIFMDT